MIKKAIIILLLCLPLSGCFLLAIPYIQLHNALHLGSVRIEPDQLPNAVVGKPYHVKVKVFTAGYYERIKIIPEDALSYKWNEVDNERYSVEIYGTPKKKGVIKVNFFVESYHTMVGAKEYSSTRKIIVKEQ